MVMVVGGLFCAATRLARRARTTVVNCILVGGMFVLFSGRLERGCSFAGRECPVLKSFKPTIETRWRERERVVFGGSFPFFFFSFKSWSPGSS
jgi:hypothetical protein